MRSKGFTLVELVIALAITALLTVVAIPAYGSFARQQNLTASLTKIVGCMQQAQQNAAAPSATLTAKTIGYSSVELSQSNGQVTCKQRLYTQKLIPNAVDGQDPNLEIGTAQSQIIQNLRLCSINNVSFAAAPMRLYFSVRQRGIPVAIFNFGASPVPITGHSRGINLDLLVAEYDPSDSNGSACSDSGRSAHIVMSQLGAPIYVK